MESKTAVTPALEALAPPEMAVKAEVTGEKKASTPALALFLLAVLAGAFVAVGAIFATSATAGAKDLPYGVVKLIAGMAFSVGLILVVIGGAELFTGNTLIVMAYASRRIRLAALLRNWGIVYFGNFAGAIATAGLVFLSGQHAFGGGAMGLAMLSTGEAKTSLGFLQAVALGILCNCLVCLAVWLTYSARTTADKILAIVLPVAAFVTAGFEHSVANMYFIPIALFVRNFGGADFFAAIGRTPADFPHLTWGNFIFANLLPVTIGNIIGGAIMVGMMYWLVYRRGR